MLQDTAALIVVTSKAVRSKIQYVIDKKLSGIMFWQLGEDTFTNGLLDAIDAAKNGKPVAQ